MLGRRKHRCGDTARGVEETTPNTPNGTGVYVGVLYLRWRRGHAGVVARPVGAGMISPDAPNGTRVLGSFLSGGEEDTLVW